MKSETLFKKIGVILNELQDQYDYLIENQSVCKDLEYSLFQANADFLADHAKILVQFKQEELGKQENQDDFFNPSINTFKESPILKDLPTSKDSATSNEPPLLKESNTNESFTFENPLNESISNEQNETIVPIKSNNDSIAFEFENKTVNELYDRALSIEEEQILANKFYTTEQPSVITTEFKSEEEIGPEPFLITKEVSESTPEVTLQPVKQPSTVQLSAVQESSPSQTDTTKAISKVPVPKQESIISEQALKSPSLNDLFNSKKSDQITNVTLDRKISDLKQGINLNDKLVYIKDLFNGYNLAYSEAIEVANKLPDFQAADTFFQKNYASQYNWADKPATVEKFYDLLKSRF